MPWGITGARDNIAGGGAHQRIGLFFLYNSRRHRATEARQFNSYRLATVLEKIEGRTAHSGRCGGGGLDTGVQEEGVCMTLAVSQAVVSPTVDSASEGQFRSFILTKERAIGLG